jgi:hypothetical protein
MREGIDSDQRCPGSGESGCGDGRFDGRGYRAQRRLVDIILSQPSTPAAAPSTRTAHLLEGEWDSTVSSMESGVA